METPRESIEEKKKRARRIMSELEATYPGSTISLHYSSPFQLLVSVILSAQCTDASVNKVTPTLFSKYPTPAALSAASTAEVERIVHSTGFFSAKTKSIQGAARMLVEQFNGIVPQTMDELTRLPGVGRKTANVVLWNAFEKNEGIAVDTHVLRIARRLGLSTDGTNPIKTELQLQRIVLPRSWGQLTHRFIAHGRAICTARAPKCQRCPLFEHCPYGPKNVAAQRRGVRPPSRVRQP